MNRLLVFLLPLVACVGIDVLDIELFEERIEVSSYPLRLQVGDTFQLEAVFFDSIGQPSSSGLLWRTLSPEIADVSEGGQLIGYQEGRANLSVTRPSHPHVQATVSVDVSQGQTLITTSVRTGILQGVGGYDISGDILMYEDSISGELILKIFQARIDNTAPGPFFYLSNQLNTLNGGISFGEAFNGNYEFVLPDSLTVQSYDVLVVWCEPFGVTLGYGEFDE